MAFTTPTDIANRALQIAGRRRITDLDGDISAQAEEIRACYDSLRKAELERNLWTFATKRIVLRSLGIDSVTWTPPAWSSGSNYSAGAVVTYKPAAGPYKNVTQWWMLDAAKTGSTTAPDLDPDWHLYTGPLALDLYDSSITYYAGEIVLVPSTWSNAVTYAENDVVNYSGSWYVSLVASNLNYQPDTSTTQWVKWTGTGRSSGSFGKTTAGSPEPLTYPGTVSVYRSLYNTNSDSPLTAGNVTWVSMGSVTIKPLVIVWPISAGPTHDITSDNLFHLPNGFLKRAPTNPKGGQNVWLGAASGVNPEDWVIEDQYIVSGDSILIMRFVANMIDVPDMHTLFCEALASRIADEIGPELDADRRPQLMAKIERNYNRKISEARTVNAIEVGPISPVECRYITVRA